MSNADEPNENREKPEGQKDPIWLAVILFGGLAVVLIAYVLLKR